MAISSLKGISEGISERRRIIDNEKKEAKLRRDKILSIENQKITRDYLVETLKWLEEDLLELYGGISNDKYIDKINEMSAISRVLEII